MPLSAQRDFELNPWEECPNFCRVEAEHFQSPCWYAPVFIKYIHTQAFFFFLSLQILKFSWFITQMNIQTITYQLCKIGSTWIQYDQKKTIASCSIMIKNVEKNAQNSCLSTELRTVSQIQKLVRTTGKSCTRPKQSVWFRRYPLPEQNIISTVLGNFCGDKGSTLGGTICWQIEIVSFEIFSPEFCLPNDVLYSLIVLLVFD